MPEIPEYETGYEEAETPDAGKPIAAITITIPIGQAASLTAELDELLVSHEEKNKGHVAGLFVAIDKEYTTRMRAEAESIWSAPEATDPREDHFLKRGFIEGYLSAKGAGRA